MLKILSIISMTCLLAFNCLAENVRTYKDEIDNFSQLIGKHKSATFTVYNYISKDYKSEKSGGEYFKTDLTINSNIPSLISIEHFLRPDDNIILKTEYGYDSIFKFTINIKRTPLYNNLENYQKMNQSFDKQLEEIEFLLKDLETYLAANGWKKNEFYLYNVFFNDIDDGTQDDDIIYTKNNKRLTIVYQTPYALSFYIEDRSLIAEYNKRTEDATEEDIVMREKLQEKALNEEYIQKITLPSITK